MSCPSVDENHFDSRKIEIYEANDDSLYEVLLLMGNPFSFTNLTFDHLFPFHIPFLFLII
jgi:hypothetical protein